MRMSLRGLLVLVACVALAIVSLKYATNELRGVVGLVVLSAYVGSIIAAVIDRGPRQAFAIGMALAMTIYGGMILCSGRVEGPDESYELLLGVGRLPTSNLLDPLYQSIVEYEDVKENGTVMRQIEHPESAAFMMIGHYWWALLLGYIGGRFARFLYVRRTGDAEK